MVHYGADINPLEALMHMISAVQRGETGEDARVGPGDEVRLVGELPESLAGYDETWLRRTVFVVRHVGGDATVDVQSDLTEDLRYCDGVCQRRDALAEVERPVGSGGAGRWLELPCVYGCTDGQRE
ncbi:hypothetical protein ACLQ28_13340 [Micromonospora sp. DT201]|uniref:hypothetical protein n=1 Tax=Micromonospora sp. DT201 TaxID=3393442 RepID=UPI003CEEF7E7